MLLEVFRCRSIEILFLVKTWHAADTIAIRRLRIAGFAFADRPRPRPAAMSRIQPVACCCRQLTLSNRKWSLHSCRLWTGVCRCSVDGMRVQGRYQVVGDFSVRTDYPQARRLVDLVDEFCFSVRITMATHQLGGTIDAVVGPDVRTVDVRITIDHHLLEW